MNVQELNPFRPLPARRSLPHRFRRQAAPAPLRDEQTGFLFHAAEFPLEYRRLWFTRPEGTPQTERSDFGLIFDCDRYIRTGATLEIIIPLRGEPQTFRGQVVLVRQNADRFEIGLWLQTTADAARLRIVEQICHIEAYLQQKKYAEGPYALNRERLAAEWISRYAGNVPTLSASRS